MTLDDRSHSHPPLSTLSLSDAEPKGTALGRAYLQNQAGVGWPPVGWATDTQTQMGALRRGQKDSQPERSMGVCYP